MLRCSSDLTCNEYVFSILPHLPLVFSLLQVLMVYQDGKVIAQNNPANSPKVFTLSVPVKAGSRYLIVVEGTTGDPYGGYRGHPGVR